MDREKAQTDLLVRQVVVREPQHPKGFRFWMVFVAICVSLFLSALEFVSVL